MNQSRKSYLSLNLSKSLRISNLCQVYNEKVASLKGFLRVVAL